MCAVLAIASGLPWALLWGWMALSCALLSWAYARNRPGILGKREGHIPWSRQLLLLPYLLALRIGYWWIRRVRPLSDLDEVAPGVWVGGSLRAEQIPPGTEILIDLVAELPEPAGVRRHPAYRGFPLLDGHHPPDVEAFLPLLLEAAAAEGDVVVHCESGVGRAPTTAALVLIVRGVVPDAASAVELMAKRRPKIGPTRSDYRFVEQCLERVRGLG